MRKLLGLIFVLLSVCATPALAEGTPSSFPGTGFGGIIVIILCVTRRKEEIGGWLMYYYIQLYLGLLMTVVFAAMGFENYLPGTWAGAMDLYGLFLLSTLPGVLLSPIELVVAERLRKSRDPRFVRLLRGVLWAHLVAAVLGLAIDMVWFRESLMFSVLALGWPLIWLPYFYRSKRVQRVFFTRDWLTPPAVVSAAS